MFKALLTVAALAAPAALAVAQPAQNSTPRQWVLEVAPGGCIVHAASANGSVISIWGSAGQDDLSFLVQNRGWNSLQDGSSHDLTVSFDNQRAWPVKATAKTNLDSDGPGLTFAVSPGSASGGVSFLEQFAAADGMHISRNGSRVDTLRLSDTGTAMTALAKCLRQVWTAGAGAEGSSTGGGAVITVSADAKAI